MTSRIHITEIERRTANRLKDEYGRGYKAGERNGYLKAWAKIREEAGKVTGNVETTTLILPYDFAQKILSARPPVGA